jgi:hypothetical protein
MASPNAASSPLLIDKDNLAPNRAHHGLEWVRIDRYDAHYLLMRSLDFRDLLTDRRVVAEVNPERLLDEDRLHIRSQLLMTFA